MMDFKSFAIWKTLMDIKVKLLQIFLQGLQGENGVPGVDGTKGEKVIKVI